MRQPSKALTPKTKSELSVGHVRSWVFPRHRPSQLAPQVNTRRPVDPATNGGIHVKLGGAGTSRHDQSRARRRESYEPAMVLADFTASGDAPAAHHLLIAKEKNLVVHVHAGADVVGNHGEGLTHVEAVRGFCDIQVAVLFVEFD